METNVPIHFSGVSPNSTADWILDSNACYMHAVFSNEVPSSQGVRFRQHHRSVRNEGKGGVNVNMNHTTSE